MTKATKVFLFILSLGCAETAIADKKTNPKNPKKESLLERDHSYFGVIRVLAMPLLDPFPNLQGNLYRDLMHGNIAHGKNFKKPQPPVSASVSKAKKPNCSARPFGDAALLAPAPKRPR